jgi:hypothetical protein
MISITDVDKHYYRCNACLGDKDIKTISYGTNENATTSFRLCRDCRNELFHVLGGNHDKEGEDNE